MVMKKEIAKKIKNSKKISEKTNDLNFDFDLDLDFDFDFWIWIWFSIFVMNFQT